MTTDLEQKKKLFREELEKLKQEFKVELPKKIAEARAYGDLRENAEYDAARERQAFVKARIAQLTDQLGKLNEMNMNDIPSDRIGFGAEVTVVDRDSDDRLRFVFVSSNDVNPSEGKISLSSPVGQALQNKMAGENVEVTIPAGVRKYYIEKIVTIHGDVHEKAYVE
jgi:transcription elongation factor GreA